jgi:hypothetical protein
MPFPFSLEGTVAIEMVDLASTMSAVETAIRKAKPGAITRDGAKITFRAGAFRLGLMTNWNVLIPIGSGELFFSQEGDLVLIRYAVSLVELFVTVTVMLLIMLGIVPILAGEHTLWPLGFLPVAWLWLFGMNYLTTKSRFPRFLRRAGEKARAIGR